jgi:hypothetical protein
MMNRSDFKTSTLSMCIYGESKDCVAVPDINPGRVMIEIDDRVPKNVPMSNGMSCDARWKTKETSTPFMSCVCKVHDATMG